MSAAEQLKLLHQLQQIDQQVMEVERFHKAAPEQIAEMERELEQKGKMITDKKAILDACREQRRDKERDLEGHEAHILKNQGRMMAVKTNEEYHAIQKENTKLKAMIEELEDRLLRIMDDIDGADLAVKKAKDRYAEIEQDMRDRIAELSDRLTQVRNQLAEFNKKRDEFIPGIDPTFLNRYNRLRKITAGVAVVRVIERTCQGCRMNIPPQLFNLVIRNEEIIVCPNCRRILYYEPEAEDAAAPEINGG